MSLNLAHLEPLIDLVVEAVVRELENDCAPKAARPTGRGDKEHGNDKERSLP